MYQKEIIYMGLHKDGSRIGSAGFLKAEKRDKTSVLTMTVKNIPRSIEGTFPVRYCLGTVRGGQAVETGGADAAEQTDHIEWKEEDGITLRDGGGVWKKKESEAAERIYVQVVLPNGYLVKGESKAAMEQIPPKEEISSAEPVTAEPRGSAPVQWDFPAAEPTVSAPVRRFAPVAEPVQPAEQSIAAPVQPSVPVIEPTVSAPVQRTVPVIEPAVSAPVQRTVPVIEPAVSAPVQRTVPVIEPTVSAPVQRSVPAAEPTTDATSQPVVPQRPPLMADALAIEGLKEDKWEQILDTYDQIHPYGDDRVYVKIAPKDFIILSGNCQHLVNNSFLLHGFYNYRYVILGRGDNSLRESSSGEYAVSSPEEVYFLGVPGVFYEREKMVALMFGFEAFECEGGNPKPGDFGYYLRKVEL